MKAKYAKDLDHLLCVVLEIKRCIFHTDQDWEKRKETVIFDASRTCHAEYKRLPQKVFLTHTTFGNAFFLGERFSFHFKSLLLLFFPHIFVFSLIYVYMLWSDMFSKYNKNFQSSCLKDSWTLKFILLFSLRDPK